MFVIEKEWRLAERMDGCSPRRGGFPHFPNSLAAIVKQPETSSEIAAILKLPVAAGGFGKWNSL